MASLFALAPSSPISEELADEPLGLVHGAANVRSRERAFDWPAEGFGQTTSQELAHDVSNFRRLLFGKISLGNQLAN